MVELDPITERLEELIKRGNAFETFIAQLPLKDVGNTPPQMVSVKTDVFTWMNLSASVLERAFGGGRIAKKAGEIADERSTRLERDNDGVELTKVREMVGLLEAGLDSWRNYQEDLKPKPSSTGPLEVDGSEDTTKLLKDSKSASKSPTKKQTMRKRKS